MSTEIESYVGKDVTVSIGGITVVVGADAMIRYEKDRYEIDPLGQEEIVQRSGHRRIKWEVGGAQISPYAWVYAIGSVTAGLNQTDLQNATKAGSDGGYPVTTTTSTTIMNKYEGIDFTLEMTDPVSSKRQIFTISNNIVTVAQLNASKGFVMYKLTAFGTDISIDYQDTSSE